VSVVMGDVTQSNVAKLIYRGQGLCLRADTLDRRDALERGMLVCLLLNTTIYPGKKPAAA
jgi:hypothetical protein